MCYGQFLLIQNLHPPSEEWLRVFQILYRYLRFDTQRINQAGGGTTFIGTFLNEVDVYAQVPEPTSMSLLGVGAILLSFAPNLYLVIAARRRLSKFNNQLGDTINLLANSLRSGYSFLQSMELVSREAPAPMSIEFRRVVQEVGLGLSTEDALDNLAASARRRSYRNGVVVSSDVDIQPCSLQEESST